MTSSTTVDNNSISHKTAADNSVDNNVNDNLGGDSSADEDPIENSGADSSADNSTAASENDTEELVTLGKIFRCCSTTKAKGL
jgi:hypothetical protein